MILQVLQTLIGIAVSLCLAIFAVLAYSTYHRHKLLVAKAGVDETLKSRNLMTGEIMQRGTDYKQTIIRLYWLLRNELHSTWKLPPMTRQTEREIIGKLRALSINELAIDTFHKVYLVYERVRFGNSRISEHELELFLNDVRSIETSSRS